MQYDYTHRVLAMLYATSQGGAALSSSGAVPLHRSLLLERLEREAERAILGEPSYLTDGDSAASSWAEAPFSPSSQLSAWSDGEEAESRGEPAVLGLEAPEPMDGVEEGDPAAQQQRPEPALGSGASPVTAGATLARQATVAGLLQQQQLQSMPRPGLSSPYQRSSLAVWLASKRSGGHPQRLLDPRLCFPEQELVQQVGQAAMEGRLLAAATGLWGTHSACP